MAFPHVAAAVKSASRTGYDLQLQETRCAHLVGTVARASPKVVFKSSLFFFFFFYIIENFHLSVHISHLTCQKSAFGDSAVYKRQPLDKRHEYIRFKDRQSGSRIIFESTLGKSKKTIDSFEFSIFTY